MKWDWRWESGLGPFNVMRVGIGVGVGWGLKGGISFFKMYGWNSNYIFSYAPITHTPKIALFGSKQIGEGPLPCVHGSCICLYFISLCFFFHGILEPILKKLRQPLYFMANIVCERWACQMITWLRQEPGHVATFWRDISGSLFTLSTYICVIYVLSKYWQEGYNKNSLQANGKLYLDGAYVLPISNL